jgi:hypothetical protein
LFLPTWRKDMYMPKRRGTMEVPSFDGDISSYLQLSFVSLTIYPWQEGRRMRGREEEM